MNIDDLSREEWNQVFVAKGLLPITTDAQMRDVLMSTSTSCNVYYLNHRMAIRSHLAAHSEPVR